MALGVSLGPRDGVVQFLDWSRDTPLNLIVTGKLANLTREFFVRFALWVIKAQRVAPWVFDWPGKRKMRRLTVDEARPTAPVAVGPSAMRAER